MFSNIANVLKVDRVMWWFHIPDAAVAFPMLSSRGKRNHYVIQTGSEGLIFADAIPDVDVQCARAERVIKSQHNARDINSAVQC